QCLPPGGYRFHGLCLQPPTPIVVGRACSSPPCLACGSTRLRANDATLGNTAFALSIFNAPAGATAIPIIGLGPCGAGVPALCGQFHPLLAPVLAVLPALTLSGSSPCIGAAAL